MTRGFWTAPVLVAVAGIVLLLAGGAGWVSGTDSREIGGVVVDEPVDRPGTEYAPVVVVFGLVGLLGGAALAAVRGRGRRILGAVVAVTGLVATGLVGLGIAGASAAAGGLTPAPLLSLVAAAALAAGGLLAVRGPARPPGASRYRVEQELAADDEWDLAADDQRGDV